MSPSQTKVLHELCGGTGIQIHATRAIVEGKILLKFILDLQVDSFWPTKRLSCFLLLIACHVNEMFGWLRLTQYFFVFHGRIESNVNGNR